MFCGNYHSDHPMRLIRILYHELKDKDVDVRYYLGTESSGFLDAVHMDENRFDYQYGSLYSYSRFDNLDVMIISYGTISIYQKDISLEDFLSRLPDVPKIILEDEVPREGCCSVVTDNRAGIRRMVDHLVRDHHIKRPAFVTGPLHNVEAQIRFSAFKEETRALGVEVPESRIVYGDFSSNVDPLIEDLLNREPDIDAIVCSNDDMAVSVNRVLKKRGLIPGRDIALTGFDNAAYSPDMDPPLTTVDQNLLEGAREALKLAREAIEGKTNWDRRVVVVEPEMIYRSSCGCGWEDHDDPVTEKKAADQELYTINRVEMRSWTNALLLRELLLQSKNPQNFYMTLGQQMVNLGSAGTCIWLLDQSQSVSCHHQLRIPPEMRLAMHQNGSTVEAFETDLAPIIREGELETFIETERPRQMFSFLLFYQERQYGVFTVCCAPESIPYYYGLSLEIGTGIRFQNLMREQAKLYAVLSDRNQALDFTSRHDTLTRLYNRTGVMQKVPELVAGHENDDFAAIMADLDHLKQINDTFGHIAGDFAIKTAAGMMMDALPEGSILGRFGGDEFMALMRIRDENTVKDVLARIRKNQENFDKTSDKPYYIELSAGYTLFKAPEAYRLEEIINRADAALYTVKKKRRASVIRQRKPAENET